MKEDSASEPRSAVNIMAEERVYCALSLIHI